jgi:hypothetical protein
MLDLESRTENRRIVLPEVGSSGLRWSGCKGGSPARDTGFTPLQNRCIIKKIPVSAYATENRVKEKS